MGVLRLASCVLLLSLFAVAQQASSASTASAGQGGSGNASLPDAPSAVAAKAKAKQPRLVANQPFVPLTGHQKAIRWLHYSYSPYTFTSAMLNATWAQMMGDWPSYGGGMQGYGKRFGATLANTETGGFFKVFLLPTLLHDDPRYFYSGKQGVGPRAWYAATRVLFTRKDDGRTAFNFPEIIGVFFTAAVTNAYYPEADRGFGATMSRGFGGITSDAGSDMLREFWPDISRIFHKHEPERMKKIEQKIPKPIEKAATGQTSND